METSTKMKEDMVKNYILNLDLSNFKTNNLTIKEIKEGLKNILGDIPGVEINYKKDIMIKEENGVKKRILDDNIKSITVAFIDGEKLDHKSGVYIPCVHRFEYIIGQKIWR